MGGYNIANSIDMQVTFARLDITIYILYLIGHVAIHAIIHSAEFRMLTVSNLIKIF